MTVGRRCDNKIRSLQGAFVFGFLLLVGLPLALMPFTDHSTISSKEQRRLAPVPNFDLSESEFTEITNSVSVYMDDHFGMRDQVLAFANRAREVLFGKSKARDVMIGSDDWLYVNMDGAIYDYVGAFEPTEQALSSWRQALLQRTAWFKEQGIVYLMVVVPSKASVYPEHLPPRIRRAGGVTRGLAGNNDH